jgi:dihydroorotase
MLVDDDRMLEDIFSQVPALIATHCEYEPRVKERLKQAIERFGDDIPPEMHPLIRDEEACFRSSSRAIDLALRYKTRLHVLHITTSAETDLFTNDVPLKEKKITAEVCVHHLHFTSDDYARLGNQIKCNPAIKAPANRDALWKALLDDRLDIIATDHAPHTWEEKQAPYAKSPSGLPMVQHSLLLMLEYAKKGAITYEKVVQKMAHAPAECFRVRDRGFIREGYKADLVLVDPAATDTVSSKNILYQCGWSPLNGYQFSHRIVKVFVNGCLSWDKGFTGDVRAERLHFFV